jgi:hypothetical protein
MTLETWTWDIYKVAQLNTEQEVYFAQIAKMIDP